MRILLFLGSIFCNLLVSGQGNPKLVITPLAKNFYVYTTFSDPGDGSLFPSNGMYVVTDSGVIVFDTPWDTTQFQPLIDGIKLRHGKKVVMCISTHFHDDRTAGLDFYRLKGIRTYTGKQTDELSTIKNKPRAEYLIYNDTTFHIGQYSFQTFYPGKGHSPDNIVIWFPKEKILYGGCFIKSTETESPGNLSDADIGEWIKSVKRVQAKCVNPAFVIPGHQDWTDKNSLKHTLELLEAYSRKMTTK